LLLPFFFCQFIDFDLLLNYDDAEEIDDKLKENMPMWAFDNSINSKTENAKDKLFYLEQYTIGEPQDLVRSCGHMSAENGYKEARR